MKHPNNIVQEVLNNREQGSARLLSEYRDRLYSMALALCRDKAEAEDLVFCAIERAIDKIDTFKNQDSLYSWLCVILVNLYHDSMRKKVNRGTMTVGGATEIEPFTEPVGPDGIVSAVDSGFVRQALESLPESMREVLVLHYFMDMPTAKIAKFLAQPVGTIKSRLHYARLVLGARLGARLKKPAVALIAAGLFLVAAASAIVSALANSDGETRDAPVYMATQAPSVPQDDDSEAAPSSSASTNATSSMKQPKEKTTMTKTTIGSLFRKAVGGITTLAMTVLAANATYGDDPYIESDGTSGISTGYRMKGTSRLEVDFAMVDVGDPDTWNECRIFGTDNTAYEPSLQTCLYATYTADHDSKYFRVRAKTSASSSRPTKYRSGVDTGRHKVVFDLPNAKMVFITGTAATGIVTNDYAYSDGGTDKTVDAGVSFDGQEATLPLSLFGRWNNEQATELQSGTKSTDGVTALCAKARIYGVKIYEGGELVRDFAPCLKDGVACFKDLVNGGFIVGENTAAFSAGGDVPKYADDGYVSTAANADGGKLYFNTGYKATAKTAVALDCALTVNRNLAGAIWRLFQGSTPVFDFNLNGNNGLRYQAFNGYKSEFTTAFKGTLYDDKDVRRTFYLDNRGTAAVVTSAHTNQLVTFSQTSTSANDVSIKLASNSGGNGDFAAIKIYGCKIWEDGTLVRDFAPYVNNGTIGLRDGITGAFIAASRGSGDTTSALARGGAIVEDAYLQSAGTADISTGYKMNGSSRLEVDFSLISTATQQRIFGTDPGETFKTYLYIDGSSNYSMLSPWGQTYTTHKADTIRHTAIIDVNHGWSGLVTGCTTNWSKTTTNSYAGQEADKALPLFGRSGAYATERIYSVRIYEADKLKHEFLPYGRGAVTGLYDTVTGDVISNGSSFAFGGAGQDHGQLKAYIKPGYGDSISSGESTTLTAYAPGATSYRWLCDGRPITGGADGVLNVAWTRGGVVQAPGFKVHSYQAIAVFEDFNGVTRESKPSAAADIKCRQIGVTLIIM